MLQAIETALHKYRLSDLSVTGYTFPINSFILISLVITEVTSNLFGARDTLRFQATATLYLWSSFFWAVTQRGLVVTKVSRYIYTTGQAVVAWFLKMRPIACPETSVTNYRFRLRNVIEDRRRQGTHRQYNHCAPLCKFESPFVEITKVRRVDSHLLRNDNMHIGVWVPTYRRNVLSQSWG